MSLALSNRYLGAYCLVYYDRVFSLAEYRSCNVDCCFGGRGYVPVFPFMPVYQISVSLSDSLFEAFSFV